MSMREFGPSWSLWTILGTQDQVRQVQLQAFYENDPNPESTVISEQAGEVGWSSGWSDFLEGREWL